MEKQDKLPSGPLAGIRVVELAGLGAAPYGAMLLSDLGAEILRIDRVAAAQRGVLDTAPRYELLHRGRRSLAVDLKNPRGVEVVLRLVERADALIESFRPGVAERLGVGPEACAGRNRKLVYARLTGWGQEGPLAGAAGHDINYIALAGALASIGRSGAPPTLPLNLVGDFGGGGMLLAFGLVCGLLEARRSGRGQVIDAAMVDGTASLLTMLCGMRAAGQWHDHRGGNLLDGGAPFYDVYETADGGHVAIGALEPKFYRELLRLTGLDGEPLPDQGGAAGWPRLREAFIHLFRQRTRAEWCEILEGSDACFAPVLTTTEAANHPHLKARDTYCELDGILQPSPVPRFSRSPGAVQGPPASPGRDTREVLRESGFSAAEIEDLHDCAAVASPRA